MGVPDCRGQDQENSDSHGDKSDQPDSRARRLGGFQISMGFAPRWVLGHSSAPPKTFESVGKQDHEGEVHRVEELHGDPDGREGGNLEHQMVERGKATEREQEGYEADDLIATYARLAREAGATVTIVASDKDLMQLVGNGVTMYDTMKDKRIGVDQVIEKFGVPPEKVVDVQALAGDSVDNVPGVPGIGLKTAAQLITDYGDVETLLARASEIKQPKRREALQQNAELARISRKLVQLRDDAPPPADPVAAATPGAWTWVPIEGARCMDGSPTGVGLNTAPGSDGLLIFFMGGGACFNADTCADAFHRDGFGASRFRTEITVLGAAGPLSRREDENPLRDWNFLYVGYCTGDVHAGDNDRPVAIGGTDYHFAGYRNVRLALQRLVPHLGHIRRVLVTGVSAGGFGAAYNYDQIATAFGPAVDVSLVDDSGPPLTDDLLPPCLQRTWRTLWNLDATLPPDCAACRAQADGGGISHLLDHLVHKYPTRRLGLISSTGDSVIRGFFSWGRDGDCSRRGNFPAAAYADGLMALRRREAGTSFRTYYVDSNDHTWLVIPGWNLTHVGGTVLSRWVADMALGRDARDVGPGSP